MRRSSLSPAYLFFYLLLSDDTWRIAVGFVCAIFIGPMVSKGRGLSQGGEAMIWLMIMAIGWSISAWPAKKITGALKRVVKSASR